MRCDLTQSAVDPDPAQGMATVSGAVDWDGRLAGSVLIDIGRPGDLAPVYGFECRGTGAFTLRVPRAFGEIVLLVFVDNDMDGPTPTDPQVRSPGSISVASDTAGVALAPVVGSPIAGATFSAALEE